MKNKIVLSIAAFLFCIILKAQQQAYLLTGTYTSGKSEGIYMYQFNSNGASVKAISSVKIYNLAFVAVLPDENLFIR